MNDSLEQHGVRVVHHFGSKEYAKETHIPAGKKLVQHVHPHDHLSVLACGRALVTVSGVTDEYTGPVCLLIKAGVEHSVTAVDNVVWFCIHGTLEKDPAHVDTAILTG